MGVSFEDPDVARLEELVTSLNATSRHADLCSAGTPARKGGIETGGLTQATEAKVVSI